MNKKDVKIYSLILLLTISLSCSFFGKAPTPSITADPHETATQVNANDGSLPLAQPTAETGTSSSEVPTEVPTQIPTQAATETPAFGTEFKFYTQNIVSGDDAFTKITSIFDGRRIDPAKEGWQYVLFDLIIENTGENSLDLGFAPVEPAFIVDSGGGNRILSLPGSSSTGFSGSSFFVRLLPNIKYRFPAYASVPTAYQPDKVVLNLWYNAKAYPVTINVNESQNTITIPFAAPPANVPEVTTLEYTEPNKYTVKYSNFSLCWGKPLIDSLPGVLAPRVKAVFTVETENLGVNDLYFGEGTYPKLLGFTDTGYMSAPIFDYSDGIAPGMKKEKKSQYYFSTPLVKNPGIDTPGFNAMWIFLLNPNEELIGFVKFSPEQVVVCDQ